MDHGKRARADLSGREDFEISKAIQDSEASEDSAEFDMSQVTPYNYHKDKDFARYEATEQQWEATLQEDTEFMEQLHREREADIEQSKNVENTAKVDETRERGIRHDDFRSQASEEGTDTGVRAELEGELFIRIMSAIDATRLAYEHERDSVPKRNGMKTEFAKCLSALSSLKLVWPLPRHPFDAQALRLIEDVFKDLDATRLAPTNSANRSFPPRAPGQIGTGQTLSSSIECAQNFRSSFEAIGDVALVYVIG
jgi:hypothetical protein